MPGGNGSTEFIDTALEFHRKDTVVSGELFVGVEAFDINRRGDDRGSGLLADAFDGDDLLMRSGGQRIKGLCEQFTPAFFLQRVSAVVR